MSTREREGQRNRVLKSEQSVAVGKVRHTRILAPTQTAVDDRLSALQNLLSRQLAENLTPQVEPQPLAFQMLSGAVSSRVRRRHLDDSQKARAPVAVEKGTLAFNTNQEMLQLRTLSHLAEGLGVDMTPVSERLESAKVKFGKHRYEQTSHLLSRARKDAEKLMSLSEPRVLRRIERRIRSIKAIRKDYEPPSYFIRNAKDAIKDGRHSDALRALVEAKKSVEDMEREIVLRLVLDSKTKFMLAKKAGLNVVEALALLNSSRDMLRKGDLEGAVNLATRSRRTIEALLRDDHEAKVLYSECLKDVAVDESLGIDTSEMRGLMKEASRRQGSNSVLRTLIAKATGAAREKVNESIKLAEKSLADAHEAGADVASAEETLGGARTSLARNDFIGCLVLASSSALQSSAAYSTLLNEKLKSIDQFAKGIDGEVESLTEVQEAIAHSKEKSIEEFRKHAQLSEEIVSQAFDSAIAYTRVSQDIVKEAFDSSVSMSPDGDLVANPVEDDSGETKIVPGPAINNEDRRVKIIDLCAAGKITESQRDRLLTLIDSSVAKVNLV